LAVWLTYLAPRLYFFNQFYTKKTLTTTTKTVSRLQVSNLGRVSTRPT